MNSQELSKLYQNLTSVAPCSDTEDSYFSDKHMMTNKELCGQVWCYIQNIHNAFHSHNISYEIKINPLPNNGVNFVVKQAKHYNNHFIYTGKGYTGNVYAIARKNNIIAKIIDIFQNGAQTLT